MKKQKPAQIVLKSQENVIKQDHKHVVMIFNSALFAVLCLYCAFFLRAMF